MSRQFWAVDIVLILLLGLTSCQTTTQRLELSNDYYNIGNAYSDLGKYQQASDYYKRALELNPELNQAVYNLARTNLEIGDFESALTLLGDLEKQDGQNLMVLEMLGYAWYKLGDNDKAAEYYNKCLSLDSVHNRSLYNLCLLEMESENWASAKEYLDRLLILEDKQEYRVLRAELAVDEGNTDSAISYYEDIVLEYGGDAKSYKALKELYLQKDMYYKALDMLDFLISEETEMSIKKDLYFEKCSIEIVTLDDVILGQVDLIGALDAGFNDQDQLDELVASADSLYMSDLERIINDNILKDNSETSSESSLSD